MEERKNFTIDLKIDNAIVTSTTTVKMKEFLTLLTVDGPIDLSVEIVADLGQVPDKFHEVFLNMLTTKYYGKVSFGDNPFSVCTPVKKRRWWQLWKTKYFQKIK